MLISSSCSSYLPFYRPIFRCSILKVGVGARNDAALLMRDYDLTVSGCLELGSLIPHVAPIPAPVPADKCAGMHDVYTPQVVDSVLFAVLRTV